MLKSTFYKLYITHSICKRKISTKYQSWNHDLHITVKGDCAALEKTQLGAFSENSQSILKTAITVVK